MEDLSARTVLRRIIARRELEQEADIIATPLSCFATRPCRICGGRVAFSGEGFSQLTVCTRCGGRKKQLRLEREDARTAAIARRRSSLVEIWERAHGRRLSISRAEEVSAVREDPPVGQHAGSVQQVPGEDGLFAELEQLVEEERRSEGHEEALPHCG